LQREARGAILLPVFNCGPFHMKLPHQMSDIASEDFQRLEDLATAYWYSEVLFTSLELNIFGLLADCPARVDLLAAKTGYDIEGLSRFLSALAALGLVVEHEGTYSNGPLAAIYLTPENAACLKDFLLYRRYLSSHWQRLGPRIRDGARANERPEEKPSDGYEERTLAYVRAMDLQARLKAAESVEYLKSMFDPAPRLLLDAGGGAGAWCRALQKLWPGLRAVLFELPDTVRAARKLYPDHKDWEGIETVAGSVLAPCIREQKFDLVLFSNIIHAYSPPEASEMLKRFAACLAPGGTLLVHDYLADAHDVDPVKGALYDLHMLINTYNGRVYKLEEMLEMITGAGLKKVRFFHLHSDTSLFLAKPGRLDEKRHVSHPEMLLAQAKRLGFSFARIIEAGEIAIAPWVRLKCRFGCPYYAVSLSCPPASPGEEEMGRIISGYGRALLVQGVPPSKWFHERLLALERSVFLAGYPEALAFGAGPCPVCPSCPEDGRCRFPERARPSLESCGVDVYLTASKAGLSLSPVLHRQGYVKYVGLVLFDRKGSHASPVGPSSLDA
jgi:predicted metal-binding protein